MYDVNFAECHRWLPFGARRILGYVNTPPDSGASDAPHTVPLTGVIANRYRIDAAIGEGGMATVYRAHDLNRGVDVALKAPKGELVLQLGPERFSREIQITTTLQHPHIVPVLDAGIANGVPFYVMPLIDGETLEQRIRRSGALPIAEAVAITCDVLEGLVYAHQRGFVHRDVKPSNVMLSNGQALLADFGIARAVERTDNRKLTESGFALGTAEYMSPEQAAGDTNLDGRSDLYSVGCVLYEMLVGGPPFTAPTARAVMARHFVDPVPGIRTVRDTVPVKLEQAVMTALAKTPVDRFADAAAFHAELRNPALLDRSTALPTRAAPVTAPHRTRLLVIGAAVLSALAGTAFWRTRAAEAAPLDQHRVMVYPFVLPADFRGPRSTGEDVGTIIGNALDGTEPLRWIDGWSLLEQRDRDDIRALTHDQARALARSKRCATFVTGRLVAAGDSLRVFLALHDVRGDSVLAQSDAMGGRAEPWKQALRAVNGVLPRLIPGSRRDIADDWNARDPGAVANFLLAESAFRRVQMKDALVLYRKAIALDSTFAFAALRGAQAATWNHRSSESATMLDVATRQALPPRYGHFARGMHAYLNGRADSAATELRAALAIDPDMTVAWMQLGEVYTHLLPAEGSTDALADAAFTTARTLDSSAVNVLFHPIELRLRRGDTTAAAPLLARFRAAQPDSSLLIQLSIAEQCVHRGAAAVDWNQLARAYPLATLASGKSFAGGGAHLACASAAFSALLAVDTSATDEADARRFFAMLGLHTLQLARGQPEAAIATIDAFVARWESGASLFLLDAPFVPAMLARAQRIAAADSSAHGVGYITLPYSRRLWELGVLATHTGQLTVASAAANELQRRAVATDSAYVRHLALSLTAFVHLARGDSATAEKEFGALLRSGTLNDGYQWDEALPMGGERLTLARLLSARGAHRQAIDVATVFDSAWPIIHLLYLPASLELRAQSATALGNTTLASQYRARLAALRDNRPTALGG
jgi:tetratricopeptide (TPR) repeat protein